MLSHMKTTILLDEPLAVASHRAGKTGRALTVVGLSRRHSLAGGGIP